MTAAFNTTRIARSMIALGITLVVVTQLWATDWPPDPGKTGYYDVHCVKHKGGYGGEGICTGVLPTCESNTSGYCTTIPFSKRVDVRYYGLCENLRNFACYTFNEHWACAYIRYSNDSECLDLDFCDLMVSVGPNVCDYAYHSGLYGGTGQP